MEKKTRNILLGLGVLGILYYLYNKKTISKPIEVESKPLPSVEDAAKLPNEEVTESPLESSPEMPIASIPEQPISIQTLPSVVVEEPTPVIEQPVFEEKPIVNSLDSFVYYDTIESQNKKVEQYITIGNAINDFTTLGSLHRDYRIGQIRSYATDIINSDKIKIGDRVRIYNSDEVYILGIVTEYNKSNGLLSYKEEDSFAPSDSVMYNGFSIQVLNSITEQPVLPETIIDNPIDAFVYSTPIQVDSNIIQGTVGVNMLTGNSISDICNNPYFSTSIGFDLGKHTTYLFAYTNAWANSGESLSGIQFYTNTECTIPYTGANYIAKREKDAAVYEMSYGYVGKEVAKCKMKVREVVGLNMLTGNSILDVCNNPYFSTIGGFDLGRDTTYLFAFLDEWANSWQGLTGIQFYADSSCTIPYTNAKYIAQRDKDAPVYEIENGLVGKALDKCYILNQNL